MHEMQELFPRTQKEGICPGKQQKAVREQGKQVPEFGAAEPGRLSKMGYIPSQDVSEIKHDHSPDFHQKLGKQN